MLTSQIKILISGGVLLLASPVILIGAILLEVAIFGTRHISDAGESLGLTNFLTYVFNWLGING